MVLGKEDYYMHKNKIGPYLTPLKKTNLKWISDLNVRLNTLRLYIPKKLLDISLGKCFFWI